jgi:hypothetical protein
MAGSLVQVATNTVSGAVSAVALTGINSDDVYMVSFNNVVGVTNNVGLQIQLTKSGSAQSDANYDYSYKNLRADTTFSNTGGTNQTAISLGNTGTSTSESSQGIVYLYNFNSGSKYSYFVHETAHFNATPFLTGAQGGIVHTVASASDGVNFKMSSGNINSGTFTLYKVV